MHFRDLKSHGNWELELRISIAVCIDLPTATRPQANMTRIRFRRTSIIEASEQNLLLTSLLWLRAFWPLNQKQNLWICSSPRVLMAILNPEHIDSSRIYRTTCLANLSTHFISSAVSLRLRSSSFLVSSNRFACSIEQIKSSHSFSFTLPPKDPKFMQG